MFPSPHKEWELLLLFLRTSTAALPCSRRTRSNNPQQIPEIMDITKPYAYYVFPYTYTLMLKFNLQNRQRKSLTTITNNITEQLYKMLLKNSVIEVFFSAYLIGRCS